MPDAAGRPHCFHFEVRLLGDRVAFEAFAVDSMGTRPRGTNFAIGFLPIYESLGLVTRRESIGGSGYIPTPLARKFLELEIDRRK